MNNIRIITFAGTLALFGASALITTGCASRTTGGVHSGRHNRRTGAWNGHCPPPQEQTPERTQARQPAQNRAGALVAQEPRVRAAQEQALDRQRQTASRIIILLISIPTYI